MQRYSNTEHEIMQIQTGVGRYIYIYVRIHLYLGGLHNGS